MMQAEYFHLELTPKWSLGSPSRLIYGLNYSRDSVEILAKRFRRREEIKLVGDNEFGLGRDPSRLPYAQVEKIRVIRTTESKVALTDADKADLFAEGDVIATFDGKTGIDSWPPESPTVSQPTSPTPSLPDRSEPDPRAVMVVHGRDEKARRALFDFLRALGLWPLEWGQLVADGADAAPYIGEVVERAFRRAKAVVVLLTPDDEARLREEFRRPNDPQHERELTPQARANVLFEAGMALALHPTRTVLVQMGQVRPFSDVQGRHVVHLDGTDKPLRAIADRLERAGCAVNTSGDDWASVDRFV